MAGGIGGRRDVMMLLASGIVQRMQIEKRLLEGCRRLAGKGFLNSPADSFSMRIPGTMEMILAS